MPRLATANQIDSALKQVRDQSTFINGLLIDALQWDIRGQVEEIEDIAYGWSQQDLRAADLDKHVLDGQAWQIQPLTGSQPWGVFLLEFARPDAFITGRGLVGPLRQVLRGLVPKRRQARDAKTWGREHLLFVCTHNYEHYRVAYFKAPPERTAAAPLAAFGWGPDVPARTACEFNLPALTWPDDVQDPAAWQAQWAGAFDVEKVTKEFYKSYAAAFAEVEAMIGGKSGITGEEDLRMFTQTLFNRLMFLRFVERKGWLELDGRHDYLKALFQAGGIGGKSLYQSRLRPLFFEGLAVEGKQHSPAIGKVPFLNGGLFEENKLDERAKDVPDAALKPMIGPDGLFYRYNFTIEESTPLDIEVAVDPEMLGKVFEELVTGRHESGSYYTPRPVVSFMCREALKGYLGDKVKAPAEAIAKLVDEHEVSGLSEAHADQIWQALDDVKAVDPACGSGAYLLGLLHELVALYRALRNPSLRADADFLYNLKLRIISHNLYGVDIDPFATNIAKLRLWLSLAVEADEPVALPNLDFKIETGDSLLGPHPQRVTDLYRDSLRRRADSLVAMKEQFFQSHGTTKDQLFKQVKAIELDLREQLDVQVGENVVDWRVQFPEAFAFGRGGFDIALANPPYVRKENIERDIKADLRSQYSAAVTSQSDLFCYFYVRAIELLRANGMHVFVCSNSWLDSGYGGALQGYLLDNCEICAIYDSAIERQFATADINTIISVIRKSKPLEDTLAHFVSLRDRFDDAIRDSAKRIEATISHKKLRDAGIRNGTGNGRASYHGDKWGGKYLRAPKIYHEVVSAALSTLVPLSRVARIEGYIHDNNTGDEFPRRRFLKSVKNAETIRVTADSRGVVDYGVKQQGNSSVQAPILFPRTFGERHVIVWNPEGVFGKEFYKVTPQSNALAIAAQLNSTFGILQREVLGLANLGEGALKFSADDVGLFLVVRDLTDAHVHDSFESLAGRPIYDIDRELLEPDRFALDDVMFDRLGLTPTQRAEVRAAARSLVKARMQKASSI